jgi:N utilization substance protein A
MSNLDMSEAVRMLADHHGISVDSLLQVLVEALATAYKKRPGAADEVIVEVNPESLDMKFTAYDVDDDGNWVNERDDTPSKNELGRIAAATFKQVMSQRIREVERDRKFEEYANREGDLVTGIIQQSDGRYALLDGCPYPGKDRQSVKPGGELAAPGAKAPGCEQAVHQG